MITRLISENDLSPHAFAKRTGVNHVTVNKILQGVTTEVQLKTKGRIERAFGIKIDTTDPNNLIVTKAPVSKLINDITNELIERPALYGNYVLGTVSSGRSIISSESQETVEELNYPADTHFWYIMDKQQGDCLFPFLSENDKILVDRSYPQRLVKESDLVFVQYSGKATVRFFSRSESDANMLVFYCPNSISPPLVLHRENCVYYKIVLIKKI